jgi:hypothetical protein
MFFRFCRQGTGRSVLTIVAIMLQRRTETCSGRYGCIPQMERERLVREPRRPASPAPRPACLLANVAAEDIKQTTMAFRSVVPGLRVEAVYSPDDVIAWASKDEWQTIVVAEGLMSGPMSHGKASRGDLATLLTELRARCPFSAIIVLGDHEDVTIGLMLAGPAADYYCTRRLGHSSLELAMLATHLVEKHRLRRELHAACRHAANQDVTMDLLGNLTHLLHSLMDYYDADRKAQASRPPEVASGQESSDAVSKKIAEVEETLVDLHGRLAMRRQRDERARLRARGSGIGPSGQGGDIRPGRGAGLQDG